VQPGGKLEENHGREQHLQALIPAEHTPNATFAPRGGNQAPAWKAIEYIASGLGGQLQPLAGVAIRAPKCWNHSEALILTAFYLGFLPLVSETIA
jgi:hypothetical protein